MGWSGLWDGADQGEAGLEDLVQQRERSGLGVRAGSLFSRRQAIGTPGVCLNTAMSSRSGHDVGRHVGQTPHSATELLQDTCQPLRTPTSPVSREHHCGPQAGRPEAHPGSKSLGWLQLVVLVITSSLSLGLLICTILAGSCHFLPTLKVLGSGPSFTPLWREGSISTIRGRPQKLLRVGR